MHFLVARFASALVVFLAAAVVAGSPAAAAALGDVGKPALAFHDRQDLGAQSVFHLPGVYDGAFFLFAVSPDSAPDAVCKALGKNRQTAAAPGWDYHGSYVDSPGLITLDAQGKIRKIGRSIGARESYLEYVACE